MRPLEYLDYYKLIIDGGNPLKQTKSLFAFHPQYLYSLMIFH